MKHLLAVTAILMLAACTPRYSVETCGVLEGKEADTCWFHTAVDSDDFTYCTNIGDSDLRNLCQRDPLQEDLGSSSSAVTESSASSAPVAFTGSVAPFDACPGFFKYISKDWFIDVEQKLSAQDITPEFEIEEACLSADYLIVVMRGNSGAAPVLRYDVRSRTLLWATQDDGKARRIVTSFGKRDGDLIPLMLNDCRSGTYNVRTNTVTADGDNCGDVVCSGGLGDDHWPSSPKYTHLTHLGPIFTAADCGEARLKEIHPKPTYTIGSTIFLGVHASAEFEQELIKAGYSCEDGACLTWRNQSDNIQIPALLRLRPYVGEMKADDCFYCG